MSAMTPIPWLKVLEQAARMAGFLKAPERGLSGSEQTEMLHIGNATLDALKINRCFMYQILRTEMPVKAYQQDYGVGDALYAPTDGSAYWIIERPEKILGAGFLVPTTPANLEAEVPMQVALDYVQWKGIVTKAVQSSQPRFLYYQALYTPGIGRASLWPIPYVDSTLVIYTPAYISEFDDVNTPIIFPKGYRIFLEYELAVAAHHRHPTLPMDPQVPVLAKEYKAAIMAAQLTPLFIQSDPAVMQSPTLPGIRWYDARTWPGGY